MSATGSADLIGELEVVLNDGSKDTGGRHEQVSAQTLAKIAEQVAQEIVNQYEVSYSTAEGSKPGMSLYWSM